MKSYTRYWQSSNKFKDDFNAFCEAKDAQIGEQAGKIGALEAKIAALKERRLDVKAKL